MIKRLGKNKYWSLIFIISYIYQIDIMIYIEVEQIMIIFSDFIKKLLSLKIIFIIKFSF
jgi:hypothetical protein